MNKLAAAIARGLEKQAEGAPRGGGKVLIPKGPSTNKLYRGHGRNKQQTPAYKTWQREAGPMINVAKSGGGFHQITQGWYRLTIWLHPKDAADVDNRAKAPLDLLRRMGATPDDKWCWDCRQCRCWSVPLGMMMVEFWPVDDDETACPEGKP